MRGTLHFEEMDFTHMDNDAGIDVADFMQHIGTKHHGKYVPYEMEFTSWTWAWLTYMEMDS